MISFNFSKLHNHAQNFFGRACFSVAALLILFAPTSHASVIFSDTFDANPVLSASQASEAYYTDRFAPAGFSSESFLGDDRLALTLSQDDGATKRDSSFSSGFYNTQGRKYDIAGATSISIDMFIAEEFRNVDARIGGIWGTAINATNNISFFPIIEFIDGSFDYWDGTSFATLPGTFSYDTFATLAMSLDPIAGQVSYSINGGAETTINAGSSVGFSNLIIQGINTNDGVDRTIYFDNLVASGPNDVPAPATLALLGLGLAGLGCSRRKKV